MNNRDVLFDQMFKGAIISSCDFVYISRNDDGSVRLQVIDGSNATGILDRSTMMLTEGYAVLERDEDLGNPVLDNRVNDKFTNLGVVKFTNFDLV